MTEQELKKITVRFLSQDEINIYNKWWDEKLSPKILHEVKKYLIIYRPDLWNKYKNTSILESYKDLLKEIK